VRCSKRKQDGDPCSAQAVAGTDACRSHAGRPLAEQKARGAVAVEVSKWGLGDKTLDPGITLLRLMTQSVRRAELYGQLLEQAYDAAERLRAAEVDDLPPHADSFSDRDRARQDLARVFATGGVSALIGHTYAGNGEDGVFASGEAIRGLVQLEAQERDRAALMAAKAAAAGIAKRQIELAEEQGRLVATVIRAVLVDLGHDLSDPDVLRVVSTQLRALGSGEAA
jgi:hypothetical protein